MSLASGVTIDTYEIVGQLGAGGMGEVYRARDRKLDRDVALKILPSEYSTSAEHLRRFEQEARAASALNHPSIVTIYEIGRYNDIAFIAMELVEGRDLRDLLTEGPLPLKQALRIAGRAADGLAAAHERGIVHRDLKPENVMITGGGYVKVLDFGLAKLAKPLSPNDTTLPHTSPGAVFGTVGYMSPEQASGKPTDHRSDQFSFGVILYEMIARRRPFDRNTAPETLTAIIREDHRHLRDIDPAIPAELERIVDRCLQKDPGDRYASTRDLARDLREVRDALTDSSGRRSGSHAVRRQIPVARLSGIAAGVALLAAGVFYMAREHTPLRPPARSGVKALAVLPFRDLIGQGDSQMLTDGIAETLTNRLSRSTAIRVIAPFQGADVPATATLKQIAERRGADLLLRGGVQRIGERLRVTYAVLDPDTGAQLAADDVTSSSNDIFALEDSLAESVFRALQIAPSQAPTASRAQLDPGDDQKRYVEAMGLLHKFRDEAAIDAAITRLEALLLDARDSPLVNGALARALLLKYTQSKKPALVEQAAVYAKRAADIDPTLPEVHVTLGELRKYNGKFAEAATEFNQALQLRPKYPDALVGLAETYDRMGRAAQAEQLYKQAVSLNPDWASVYMKYGVFAYTRGRYKDAVTLFGHAVELMPDSARTHLNLGAALQAMGRHEEAIASYKRAIAAGPSAMAWANLGACQFFTGKYADAVVSSRKAVDIAPDNYISWANLADAYRALKDNANASSAYEKSITVARQSLQVNASDALAHAIIASSLAKLGKTADAKSESSVALQVDPTNANALYHTAVVMRLAGDDDLAISWLARAVRAGYSAADAGRDPEWNAVRQRSDFAQALNPPSR